MKTAGAEDPRFVERAQLLPTRRLLETQSTPLSILDATLTRFTPTSCIWLYKTRDGSTESKDSQDLVDFLRTALEGTLSEFPQIAGQLRFADYNPKGTHLERWRRPLAIYGGKSDRGVDWEVIRFGYEMNAIHPDQMIFKNEGRLDVTGFPESDFVSKSPLAFHDLQECEGLPIMSVQVSLFACGGFALGVRIVHCMADSQSLLTFMHAWAANARQHHSASSSVSKPKPLFDPSALDSHATGDIDSFEADPYVVTQARNLPLHRYDGWNAIGANLPALQTERITASKPPEHTWSIDRLSPSSAPPWSSWNREATVKHVQLSFSNEMLDSLRNDPPTGMPRERKVSRMDMLVSYLWRLVNQARQLEHDSEPTYLDVTIGARSRVDPPLPETSLGSPLFIAYVQKSPFTLCNETLLETAMAVRQTLQKFDPEAIGAMLHDAAFEVSPQRLWQSFLGDRHLVVSSWMRLNIWTLEFEGTGTELTYVHPVMPRLDGFAQIHEGKDGSGMIISLHLEKCAMERLCSGLELGRHFPV